MAENAKERGLPAAGLHVLAGLGSDGVARCGPWDPPDVMPHCNRFLGALRQIGCHATWSMEMVLQKVLGQPWTGNDRWRSNTGSLAFRRTIAAVENKELL